MANNTLPLRLAVPADAAKITAIINAAFKLAEAFFVDGDRINEIEVKQLLAKGAFLLAEAGETLQGCVYVELQGQRSYLGLLSVDPISQQSGLGSLLMQVAEQYCRELGSLFMDIVIVNVRAELPAFYAKRGYTTTGTSAFPADSPTRIPCHFINMSKAL